MKNNFEDIGYGNEGKWYPKDEKLKLYTVVVWRVSRLAQEGRTQAEPGHLPELKDRAGNVRRPKWMEFSGQNIRKKKAAWRESTLEICQRSSSSLQLNTDHIDVRKLPEARERKGIFLETHTGLAIVQHIVRSNKLTRRKNGIIKKYTIQEKWEKGNKEHMGQIENK